MPVSKKFYEAVTKDPALKAELEQATLEALEALLKENGLEEEAVKAAQAAADKVAEAHGFAPEDTDELDLDELDAVAGGVCACPVVGGGTGNGKQCACVGWGQGEGNRKICVCVAGGGGEDD